jgi:CHAT domain-containing protein/tetratricopeptide (TPR) repeat protein
MRPTTWIAVACLFQLAVSAQPPQPDPLILERNRALQLADQGHERDALDIVLGIIKRAPLFQPAYANLSDLADRAGKRPETLRILRELAGSGYAGAWLGVAELTPDPTEADSAAFRCAHDAPTAWLCFIGLAFRFQASHHGRVEMADLEKRIGLPPASPNVHIVRAEVHFNDGRIQQAIQELIQALASDADLYRMAYLEKMLGAYYARSPAGWIGGAPHFRRAVELAQEGHDWPGAIAALVVGAMMLKGEQGVAMIQQALVLARDHRMPSCETLVLHNLNQIYLDEGSLGDALAAAQRGVEICDRLQMLSYRAEFMLRCARVHQLEGDHQQAITALEDVRQSSLQRGDKYHLGMSLRALGLEYETLGDYLKALQHQFEAVRVFESGSKHDAAGAQLGNIGELYKSLGDYSDALFYDRESFDMAHRFHDPAEKMRNLINLADVHTRMKQPLQAACLLQNALALDAQAKYPPWKAAALMLRGELYRSGRQPQLAIPLVEAALEIFRGQGDAENTADAMGALGGCYLSAGDRGRASNLFAQALEAASKCKNPQLVIAAHSGLAQVAWGKQDFEGSLAHLRAAADLVESLRPSAPVAELQSSFTQQNWKVYQDAVEVLRALHQRKPNVGFDREAFRYAEMGRARAFLDAMAASKSDLDKVLTAEQRQRHKYLSAALTRALSAQLEHDTAANRKLLQKAQLALTQWSVEIPVENASYRQIQFQEPNDAGQTQVDLAGSGAAMLEYMLGDRSSVVWVITADRVKMIALPARSEIEAAVRAFRAAAENREQPAGSESAARRLYRLLLAPAIPVIGDSRRLIIVPDGILYYLPFEALLDRSRHVLEDFTIAYSPSTTAYSLMRREKREQPRTPGRALLAFGDPQFRVGSPRPSDDGPALVRSIYRSGGFTFPPLPNSRTEVTGIAKLFSPDQQKTYLGANATKSALFSEKLGSYRCLHFATHAMLDERTPAQCGIALTPDGSKSDDGILRVNEIIDMKLNADMVVLSTCQSGLGQLVRGEGMIGLTRAFLYAGAHSVVVSLWKVDDLATARFMQKFYKHLRDGADIPTALRQAKLDMLGSGIPGYRNPYFWAPFVVTGAF